jgi:hypothetical protein
MQKVEGSSPFIRLHERPAARAASRCGIVADRPAQELEVVAARGLKTTPHGCQDLELGLREMAEEELADVL